MSILLAIGLSVSVPIYGGGTLVATEVIRAGDSLGETNTEAEDGTLSEDDRALFGREVRRTVYKGNVIKPSDTQPRRLVVRNQNVVVKYRSRGVEITMNGRAMGEGAAGELVSVMNPETRKLIHGQITADGWVLAQ